MNNDLIVPMDSDDDPIIIFGAIAAFVGLLRRGAPGSVHPWLSPDRRRSRKPANALPASRPARCGEASSPYNTARPVLPMDESEPLLSVWGPLGKLDTKGISAFESTNPDRSHQPRPCAAVWS